MADFKEDDHPRDDKGRFSPGALSTAGKFWSEKNKYKYRNKDNESFTRSFSKRDKSTTRAELAGVRGQAEQRRNDLRKEFESKFGVGMYLAEIYANEPDRLKSYPQSEQDKFKGAIAALPHYQDRMELWGAERRKADEEEEMRGPRTEGTTPRKDAEEHPNRPLNVVTKKSWESSQLKPGRHREVVNKLTGEAGKEPRKAVSKESREKAKETRAIKDSLGQKDQPLDILDLAALHFLPTGQGRWRRENSKDNEIADTARTAMNKIIGQHLTNGKAFEQGGWYGHYDPKNGREVVRVSDYDLGKPIDQTKSPEERGYQSRWQRGQNNPYQQIKDSKGDLVSGSFVESPRKYDKDYRTVLEEKKSPAEVAKAAGHEIWGVKKPGWYYKDTLENKEPEEVGHRNQEGRSHLGASAEINDERRDAVRFPLAVHPSLADKPFPGARGGKTYADVLEDAVVKKRAGGSSDEHTRSRVAIMPENTHSEYRGVDDYQAQNALDELSMKLWTRIEPDVRKSMSNDGGYNRFWSQAHLQEGSGGPLFGQALLNLASPYSYDKSNYDPATRKSTVEHIDSSVFEQIKNNHDHALRLKQYPKRQMSEDAWAGKIDPFTEDPMTKDEAEKRGVLKKYIEGVRAKRKTP